jgi:hypothetical protein
MAVRRSDRLGGFAPGVQVTQVVGPLGAGLGDRRTAGPWPIGHDARTGPCQGLLARAEQRGSVGVRGGP